MSREPLTAKQQLLLNFLTNHIRQKGYPPTVREIGQAVGLKSTATVHAYLLALERKGHIRRNPAKNRSIELVQPEGLQEVVPVPILGQVTAGNPILAAEDLEGYFPLPVDFLGNYDAFMLKVQGDSMEEAGIYHKDMIVVRKQPHAENGDIVVALLDDAATVKRFFQEPHGVVRLHSENALYNDIYSREVKILGKVIGLFRQI